MKRHSPRTLHAATISFSDAMSPRNFVMLGSNDECVVTLSFYWSWESDAVCLSLASCLGRVANGSWTGGEPRNRMVSARLDAAGTEIWTPSERGRSRVPDERERQREWQRDPRNRR